jgi:flavodoxin
MSRCSSYGTVRPYHNTREKFAMDSKLVSMRPHALVIYDSAYGNTERIAQAISAGLQDVFAAKVVLVGKVSPHDVASAELIIIGSPTQAGRPTDILQHWLDNLAPSAFGNTNVATFDTRFAPQDHGIGLRVVMKVLGFAAQRIATSATSKAGTMMAAPEGFIVEDKAGPLRDGELIRATSWAHALASRLRTAA